VQNISSSFFYSFPLGAAPFSSLIDRVTTFFSTVCDKRLYELFIVAGVFRSIDIDMLLRVRRLSVLVLLLRGERHVLQTFREYDVPVYLFCVKFLMPYFNVNL
jgi:hypothetical protein